MRYAAKSWSTDRRIVLVVLERPGELLLDHFWLLTSLPVEAMPAKSKIMTLDADEFIRRFLLHTLPDGFHRIRHYGFLANGHRAARLALCRTLLDVPASLPMIAPIDEAACTLSLDRCPCCGGAMIALGSLPRPEPCRSSFWHDSS